jgi:hypothetical protein
MAERETFQKHGACFDFDTDFDFDFDFNRRIIDNWTAEDLRGAGKIICPKRRPDLLQM